MARDILLNSFVNGRALPRFLRARLWRVAGHAVDPSATINPDCFLGARHGLTIEAETFVNYGCFFDLNAETALGKECSIGYEVMFVTASHELGPTTRRAGAEVAQAIKVGDGTWIGARAVILAGVTIGAGCVIAAGSVVTTDCKPNSLYAGVPAILRRTLS